MLITINVPDSLPQESLWERIRELEESLKEEATFVGKTGIREAKGIADDGDPDMRLFRESFGSWKDDRTVEEIIKDILGSRKSVERDIRL